ncbi:DUF4198 domain-containing protein [Mucilaginibacter gotjawali]|uniref:Nickel uptake substrate-specific transmembrane region n=2 Tax=Mucilaginibacter gotjawali TaxID=1550579 RepID=A0A110B0G9_9SPHI|nr:DUF4198 domain-containing protein [Mucilaginibacter gotjawali]MBB3058859.1 hypothetical protein [Mucilaginibacter gotjawali]BAU52172.1 Nickel uptake substrate-specific transmembrane region [Mucilaginibacter gotjawali]
MNYKRKIPLILLILAAAIGLAATTHDYFLLPENFFLHKGDKLNLHLLEGDLFLKQNEVAPQTAKIISFVLYSGKKKTDLTSLAKDTSILLKDFPMETSGQSLVSITTGVDHSNYSRDNYADFLTQLGNDKLADKIKNGTQFRVKEKHARYIKTLFSVDNHDGSDYEKVLGEASEIVLKDNPYKKQYGDDMVAQLLFSGKPAKGEVVALYIKSLGGNVYTQTYTTDNKGEISITMSREGIYMLRSVHVEPTGDKDADYVSWWTTYTFPFSSSDEMPNTYKEFGFGNVH